MTENGQKRGDLGSSPRSGVCTGQSEVSDRLSRTGLREKTLTVRFQFHHKEIRAGRFSLSVSGFTARHRPTRHARSFHATSAHAPFMRHNKRAALPSPGRQPRPVGLTPSPGSGRPGWHPPGWHATHPAPLLLQPFGAWSRPRRPGRARRCARRRERRGSGAG